jgi:hypothetical protein
LRLIREIVEGVDPFRSPSDSAVEPFAGTVYSAGIRVWPCFVAHLAVWLPIGNADFG